MDSEQDHLPIEDKLLVWGVIIAFIAWTGLLDLVLLGVLR